MSQGQIERPGVAFDPQVRIWKRLLAPQEVTLRGDEYLIGHEWLPVDGAWLGVPSSHLPGPATLVPAVVRRHITLADRSLVDAAKEAQEALLAYDGHVSNPMNAEGWTDQDGYKAYARLGSALKRVGEHP